MRGHLPCRWREWRDLRAAVTFDTCRASVQIRNHAEAGGMRAGVLTGVVQAVCVVTPLELIKTRQQVKPAPCSTTAWRATCAVM